MLRKKMVTETTPTDFPGVNNERHYSVLKEHNLPCQEHLIFHLPLGFSHTP